MSASIALHSLCLSNVFRYAADTKNANNMYRVERSIKRYWFKNCYNNENLKRSSELQNLSIISVSGILAILNFMAYVKARISPWSAIANINGHIIVMIPIVDVEAHSDALIHISNIKSQMVILNPIADIKAHVFILTLGAGIGVCTSYMTFWGTRLESRWADWSEVQRRCELRTEVEW